MESGRLFIANQLGSETAARINARFPAVLVSSERMEPAWNVPANADILVAGPATIWSNAPSAGPAAWPRHLQWIQLSAAGVDGYPRWIFEGPAVTSARGVNSVPIAEFVLASMLAFEKRFPEAWHARREASRRLQLGMLQGKTAGLVGLGSIGQTVARLAQAFGMEVLAYRRNLHNPAPPGVTIVHELGALLAASDHIVVAAAMTPQTRRLLDAQALSVVKPGAHLVNVARGPIIDHEALVQALRSGRIAGASLDVTEPEPLPDDHPLRALPSVRISPHVAFISPGTRERLTEKFLDNLDRFLHQQPLCDVVNPAQGY